MAKAAPKPSAIIDTRVIYCGDNLEQLRKLPNTCVDLIYLDPPFNSNADYNVLFREPSGAVSQAQFHALTDTWSWADAADTCYQLENCYAKVG